MTEDATVLIVDDEEDVADTYAGALGDRYDITTTHSGEQALEAVGPATDIVLLDRRMPGMSGDEVLEEIRDSGLECRVVMITAVEPDIDIISMAFDEYLVKPVTAGQLNDVVERMLARKDLAEQIQQMFTLASRLATLESKLDYEQLRTSEEYDKLTAEFNELRGNVTLPDGVEDPYLEATLEKLEALLQERH
jgi:DNA-binding NtrC family response regulator